MTSYTKLYLLLESNLYDWIAFAYSIQSNICHWILYHKMLCQFALMLPQLNHRYLRLSKKKEHWPLLSDCMLDPLQIWTSISHSILPLTKCLIQASWSFLELFFQASCFHYLFLYKVWQIATYPFFHFWQVSNCPHQIKAIRVLLLHSYPNQLCAYHPILHTLYHLHC